jgi:hypothetical protein
MELLACVRSITVKISRNADDYILCHQGLRFLNALLFHDVVFQVQCTNVIRTRGTVCGYSILHDHTRDRDAAAKALLDGGPGFRTVVDQARAMKIVLQHSHVNVRNHPPFLRFTLLNYYQMGPTSRQVEVFRP